MGTTPAVKPALRFIEMGEHTRRRYLKYVIGAAGALGAFISLIYLRFAGPPQERKMPAETEEATSRSGIPPGQMEVEKLRVLHVGEIPEFDPETWSFQASGLVDNPFTLSWGEFQRLPATEDVSDFHCVTGWSKLDNRWGGVSFRAIYERARPKENAKYATIICEGGYTTSLPLKDLLDEGVMFAYKLEGRELEPRYGGPLRLVVPKKYAYKSAKWVRAVKFTEFQELGFWESQGYSNTADPWTEDRYMSGLRSE